MWVINQFSAMLKRSTIHRPNSGELSIMICGIYVLANDTVYDQLVALLNSMEKNIGTHILDSAKFLEELLLAKAYSYLKVRNFLKRTISAVSQFL